MSGGKKKGTKKNKRFNFFDETYLDAGISKTEAERRAWKAISSIQFSRRG